VASIREQQAREVSSCVKHDLFQFSLYDRALGLSSLWLETIATLRDLYGNKPDSTRLAVSRDLYPSEADGNTHAFTAALSANVPTPKFSVRVTSLYHMLPEFTYTRVYSFLRGNWRNWKR
jgi:hypothetical protein